MTAASNARRDGARLRYLRFMPQLRSAYIERFEGAPASKTLFLHEEYLDVSLLQRDSYRKTTRAGVVRAVLRGGYDAIALPEPLWIVNLPFVTLLAVLAKGRSLFSRSRAAVVTYAIENADSTKLLGLPERVPATIRIWLLRIGTLPYLLCLDRIAFGTEGARQNYRSGAMAWMQRRFAKRTQLFTPLAPSCACGPVDEKPDVALFLGPLATRKGLDSLLEAWPRVAAERPDSRLVVCGTGALQPVLDEAIRTDPRITQVVTSSRDEMHRLLREAHVLVSLPRTERRWREQIGLSLTEGLSHDCRVVTTTNTGFADWLDDHGHVVLAEGADAERTAGALIAALDSAPVTDAQLPAVSGRAAAEQWMLRGGKP